MPRLFHRLLLPFICISSLNAEELPAPEIAVADGKVTLSWSGEGTLYARDSLDDPTPVEVGKTSPQVRPLSRTSWYQLVNPGLNFPNILLLIVDDWGIDSCSLYNNDPTASFPPMPTVDSLASRGWLFENAYTQPTCSPTRASILTGRYAYRTGIGAPVDADEALSNEEITIPEVMAIAGSSYAAASFGKWHLASGLPVDVADTPNTLGGWPHYAGATGGGLPDYELWTKVVDGTVFRNQTTYATTDTVNDVIDWIGQQGQKPWLAWVGFNAAHTPYHNPPTELHSYTGIPDEPIGADRRPAYEASLEAMDTEIGRLLESVDISNTYVILLGDNGTPRAVIQPPYDPENAKGTLYEGGVHVPLIIAGPGIQSAGRSDALVHCVDLFSTILEIAGIRAGDWIPESTELDGVSLLPLWEKGTPVRDYLISESFGTLADTVGRTVRDSRYKLIRTEGQDDEFYDLLEDPAEQTNLLLSSLSMEQADRYAQLATQLP